MQCISNFTLGGACKIPELHFSKPVKKVKYTTTTKTNFSLELVLCFCGLLLTVSLKGKLGPVVMLIPIGGLRDIQSSQKGESQMRQEFCCTFFKVMGEI